ncbi:MAG TPA: hypothetical protein VIJ57_04325 [Hanamia sp.]
MAGLKRLAIFLDQSQGSRDFLSNLDLSHWLFETFILTGSWTRTAVAKAI